jgi:hypothetical protein
MAAFKALGDAERCYEANRCTTSPNASVARHWYLCRGEVTIRTTLVYPDGRVL